MNRSSNRRGILDRIVEYTLDDPQRTGHKVIHRLMTNLLEADEFPAMELIMEYHERWEEGDSPRAVWLPTHRYPSDVRQQRGISMCRQADTCRSP